MLHLLIAADYEERDAVFCEGAWPAVGGPDRWLAPLAMWTGVSWHPRGAFNLQFFISTK